MTNYDPFSPFVRDMRARQLEIDRRVGDINPDDPDHVRKFLDAKLEMSRVNWAGQIGLQLRHGLVKKVTSKI